ncbi:MAG: hypothetical protein L6R38_003423 [Xanthoria sp. 2 TBL-2021]|nr:MAG: hypothetical protein L6R38_003423 [Xanthoria sp. 2 TBL-2021]
MLCQSLTDVCFPLIRLRGPKIVGQLNRSLGFELKIRIEYNYIGGKPVSWFIVSRANAAKVSQFILTESIVLQANHHLTFDTTRELDFVPLFDTLHGMTLVRAMGLSQGRTSIDLLASMKSKRQYPRQWTSYGQACLARGDMNVEEFSRRGKDGVTNRYEAAMDSFEHGWREMLVALDRIESGGLVCEPSEKEKLLDLQMRFAHTTSKHCAHDSDRDVQRVRVTRASLYNFLEKASQTIKVEDLLQLFLNMANGGLGSQDYPLALYALAKALSLRPGHPETNVLLTEFDGSFDKSWPSTTFGVRGLFNNLLSRDPQQQSSWSLVQPTSNNFAADAMQSLEGDVFEGVDF